MDLFDHIMCRFLQQITRQRDGTLHFSRDGTKEEFILYDIFQNQLLFSWCWDTELPPRENCRVRAAGKTAKGRYVQGGLVKINARGILSSRGCWRACFFGRKTILIWIFFLDKYWFFFDIEKNISSVRRSCRFFCSSCDVWQSFDIYSVLSLLLIIVVPKDAESR